MKRLIISTIAAILGLTLPAFAQEEVTFRSLDEYHGTVFADRYAHAGTQSRGTAILLHDQASNAQEYADIAPRLAAMGFEVLAVDLKTGYDTEGAKNRTYWATRAYVMTFDDRLPDAEAALAWARQELPDDPILLWGSGISADMVIVMAANDAAGIAAVLAFSPPSTLAHFDEAEAAARLAVPLFVTYGTMPTDELAMVSKITDVAPPALLTLHTPAVGSHGVATLTESANPDGWEANWTAMEAFLNEAAP